MNLDLIYGLPGQALAAWQRTLAEAIALRPEHLSLYALTLEEGTPLAADVARGRLPAPDPDLAADMYLWAGEALAAAGYQQYEISNWALPGYRCRHNLVYWHNEPYLGLGAGAHSCLGGFRFAAVRDPRAYIREVMATGATPSDDGLAAYLTRLRHLESVVQVTDARAMAETAILGLRLVEGLSLAALPPPLRGGPAVRLRPGGGRAHGAGPAGTRQRAPSPHVQGAPAGQRGLRALPAGHVVTPKSFAASER